MRPFYARLFLAACAQPLRYMYPYVVQAVRGTFTIVPPRPPLRFCIWTRLERTCARIRVPACIRRAKKRSCSIAGRVYVPACFQRVSRIQRVFINRQITRLNPTSIDPATYYEGISSSTFFFPPFLSPSPSLSPLPELLSSETR